MLLPPFPGFPALLRPWSKPVQRKIGLLDLPIEIRLQIWQSVLLTENERTLCRCLFQPARNRLERCCCFPSDRFRDRCLASGRDWAASSRDCSAIIDRLIDLAPAFPEVCRQIREESAQAFNLRNYCQLIVCDPICLHDLLENCIAPELGLITEIRHDIDMRRFTSLGGDHTRLVSELHFAECGIKLVLCFWFETVKIGPLRIKPGVNPMAQRTIFVDKPREQHREGAHNIYSSLQYIQSQCLQSPPPRFNLTQYRDFIEAWDDGL